MEAADRAEYKRGSSIHLISLFSVQKLHLILIYTYIPLHSITSLLKFTNSQHSQVKELLNGYFDL